MDRKAQLNLTLFALALNARVEYALMWIASIVEDEKCWSTRRRNAGELAWKAGYIFGDQPIPTFFKGEEELEEAWRAGAIEREDEEHEAEKDIERQKREALIEEKIEARDWEALGLPHPHDLLTALQNGESHNVGGHALTPDEDGVWITNPYGHDCALWQAVTIEDVEQFLTDMARGEEYGPVPH